MRETVQRAVATGLAPTLEADFFDIVRDDIESVESLLLSRLDTEAGLILNAGSHILESGGKRLRPIMHLLVAKLLSFDSEYRIDIAASLEYIHTATLLHDDVVDEAKMRRGKPSVNSKWGDHTSVLVGDYLFAMAFLLILKIGNTRIMDILAKACLGMAEGEAYQITKAHDPTNTEKDYLHIISKKTAGLFGSACQMAATMVEVSEEKEAALKDFGYNLGIAFQMADDALDYTASEKELGKTIGKDLEEGKATLPLIYTISQASEIEKEELALIVTESENSEASLIRVKELIEKYSAIDYTMDKAAGYVKKAKQHLDIFEPCDAKSALNRAAEYAIERGW